MTEREQVLSQSAAANIWNAEAVSTRLFYQDQSMGETWRRDKQIRRQKRAKRCSLHGTLVAGSLPVACLPVSWFFNCSSFCASGSQNTTKRYTQCKHKVHIYWSGIQDPAQLTCCCSCQLTPHTYENCRPAENILTLIIHLT